jgi:hypothetical protein
MVLCPMHQLRTLRVEVRISHFYTSFTRIENIHFISLALLKSRSSSDRLVPINYRIHNTRTEPNTMHPCRQLILRPDVLARYRS